MPALPCPDAQCLRWWFSVDPATITVLQTDHLKAVLSVTIHNLAPLSDKLLIDLLAAAEEDDRWLPLAQHLPEALAGQSAAAPGRAGSTSRCSRRIPTISWRSSRHRSPTRG